MGKLADLMKAGGSNIAESMGSGVAPSAGTAPAQAPARWQGVAKSRNAVEVPLDKIAPDPGQPREEFDDEALGRLADSLRSRGQLQPIRVRWDEASGKYMIIGGERRYRAAARAGLATLACVVSDEPLDAGELLSLQLIENCLREDLKPIEQARAFRTLMDRNGWSTHQAARELGVPQSSVVRAVALLELPAPVQEEVEQGALSPATAYEVSKLPGAEAQAELAALAVGGGMTRAEVIDEVIRRKGSPRARSRRGAPESVQLEFKVPGGTVTVTLDRAEPTFLDVYTALSKAFNVALQNLRRAS
jgi:ParB family chromosome partitioning protein